MKLLRYLHLSRNSTLNSNLIYKKFGFIDYNLEGRSYFMFNTLTQSEVFVGEKIKIICLLDLQTLIVIYTKCFIRLK